MRRFVHNLLAPLISLAMLGGLYATDAMHLRPSDVGDYHERVAAALKDVPYAVGDWIARDVPVPTQATDMLKPNALLSRQYLNTRTGQRVSVLVVHTREARDLIGHYPPECYPANGWTLTEREAVHLPKGSSSSAEGDKESLEVGRYSFVMDSFSGRDELEVLNLMVLPTGRYSLGMAGLAGVSGDYRVRHFGAAAVQLVFNPPMSEQAQAHVWTLFFQAMQPALQTIQSATISADQAAGRVESGPQL